MNKPRKNTKPRTPRTSAPTMPPTTPATESVAPSVSRTLRLEWIEAGSLSPNPRNWRRHPDHQMAAISDVLNDPDIGWAGALLFNERTGRLLDGHARQKSVGPKAIVPVLIGSWSEAAEKKILLTHDPMAAMAETNEEALQSLIDEVDINTEGLNALMTDLVEEMESEVEAPAMPGRKRAADTSPKLGTLEFRIVIDCRNEKHQEELLERFEKEGIACRALVS